MTPIHALYRQLDLHPDGVAFIAAGDVWSYRRLASEAEGLARAFIARGVRPGDRVALHMANLPEMAVAYFACFRIGAIAAPLNTRFKIAELRDVLKRLQPSLYLGQARLYPPVAAVEREILPAKARFLVGGAVGGGRAQSWAGLLSEAGDSTRLPDPGEDLPAVLLATSGSTGVCKFVAHTPATMSAIAEASVHLGFADRHVAVNAVPMVHGSGFLVLLACIRFGAPMILVETFDADAVLDGIERHQASWIAGLPFMFAGLIEAQRRRKRKVDSLRFCLSGGDVLPVTVQQQFERVFGQRLLSFWAATEAPGSLVHGLKPGPVSRIAPGAQIRIVGDDGAEVRRGEVGELLVRGPNVTIGYWTGPGRIEPLSADGWYRSGDLVRRGTADEIWFVGRVKDLIIRGGSNISPVEVERVLMEHPAVRGAAVFGVPDAVLGERVAAVVELAEKPVNGVLDEILAYARGQLADYKLPERLAVVDAIPRTMLGKVDRRTLAVQLSQAAE